MVDIIKISRQITNLKGFQAASKAFILLYDQSQEGHTWKLFNS